MTTSELAKKLGIRPESIQHRLCIKGSYFEIVPSKAANGRLIWPDDSFDLLTGAKKQEADHVAA